MFVGIDRTSKFAVTLLVEKTDRKTAWEFLQHMLEAVPYQVHTILNQVHTILTDNGIQFAEQPRNRNTAYSRPMRSDMFYEGETMSAIGPRTMVERDRAPVDQAQLSLEFGGPENGPGDCFPDKRASRADEPHDQGG